MGKKKQKPITTAKASPIVPLPQKVTSRKHARRLTTQYHDITKRMASATSEEARAECRADLEGMGGVKAYQAASALNTALNPVSRWVLRALRTPSATSTKLGSPPRVLEIGAVNTQLLDADGLSVRAIDLHTIEPRIEQCDFLTLAHGGTFDATSGRVQLYDSVVCSMVLNCVPNERKRFEMLVGIRAQLREGGRAFVTIPRTCLAHSCTLSEESFVDALSAVGLWRLDEAAATKPPDSAKIAYFECEAAMPIAEAAVRCQRARHDKRKVSKAARGVAGGRPAPSAGAAFDVDVGGHLGFGVRVPRSYTPAEGAEGRSARDQAVCRAEFLRLSAAEEAKEGRPTAWAAAATAAATAASGTQRVVGALDANDDAEDDRAGGDEGGAESARARECRKAIEREMRTVSEGDGSRIDYSQYRFYADASPSSTGGSSKGHSGHLGGTWRRMGERHALADPGGSSQARSGWQWADRGWTQSKPFGGPAPSAQPQANAASQAEEGDAQAKDDEDEDEGEGEDEGARVPGLRPTSKRHAPSKSFRPLRGAIARERAKHSGYRTAPSLPLEDRLWSVSSACCWWRRKMPGH